MKVHKLINFRNILPILNTILLVILFTVFMNQTHKVELDNGYIEVMGIIKPDGESGKWEILNDAGHKSSGLKKITVRTDHIEVEFNHEYKKVYTSAVTADDSMVLSGYSTGASIDSDKIKIYISKGNGYIDPYDINTPDNNIWIYVKGI